MIKEKDVYKWIQTPDSLKINQPFINGKLISSKDGRIKVQLDENNIIEIKE